MAEPIRVVVAEDQDLIRSSFAMLVDSEPGMTVAGQAATGAEAVAVVLREKPDVVLMDIRMPGLDGIEATAAICRSGVTARVIMLTTFDLPEYVYGALRAGASGFLLKNASPEDLLRAIRVVADGEALLAPEVTSRLVADVAASRPLSGLPPAVLPARLTERERQVITAVAMGLSNEEIAVELVLTRATVKTYVSRLLTKLDARDRAQLVVLAYESGLVRPGPG